ncbi:phosphotransferase family protein [Streptomyces sp. H72]
MNGTPSITAALHGWDARLADPPADLAPAARDRLEQLAELEAAWPGLAHGDRIVHGDLRADNMVRDHHLGVTFVDWAHATTGPACIDAASLAPQLILAGHRPADVARLLHDHPATASSPETTTAFLAALTGHWHRNARQPAPPGAPGLRAYQPPRGDRRPRAPQLPPELKPGLFRPHVSGRSAPCQRRGHFISRALAWSAAWSPRPRDPDHASRRAASSPDHGWSAHR